MSRLKNITSNAVSLQMFNTSNPSVAFVSMPVILTLSPGDDVVEQTWAVTDITDPSYNSDLITEYIAEGILTRIAGN